GQGEENVTAYPHGLEAGEAKEVLDVLHGGPVQIGQRRLEPEPVERVDHGLPEPTVPVDHDACARMAERSHALQHGADVVEVAEEIGQDDVVERLAGEREPLCGHPVEGQPWV